jgi:hypothetical protein
VGQPRRMLVDVEELSPRMRPAADLHDLAAGAGVSPVARVKGVGLSVPCVILEEFCRFISVTAPCVVEHD